VARVDPGVERLAHLPGAERGVVLALANLDADLFRADRRRAAFASASKAARRAVSGSAPPSIWPSIHDWSSPAVRAMERISAFASARVCAAGGAGVVVVSVIYVSMRMWAPGSAGVGTREISWGVQRTAVSTARRTKRSHTGRQNRCTTTLCCSCSTRRRNSMSPVRMEE
jgi:hypothetical protein